MTVKTFFSQVAQHIVGRHPSLLHGNIPVFDPHALSGLHRRVGADIAGREEVLAVLLGKPRIKHGVPFNLGNFGKS